MPDPITERRRTSDNCMTREEEFRRVAELAAQAAAETVVRVAADAAAQVAATAAHAAHALSETTMLDLQYIKKDLAEIKTRLDSKFVTIEAFNPIKTLVETKFVSTDVFDPIRRLVYGQVALALVAVAVAVLSMVIRK